MSLREWVTLSAALVLIVTAFVWGMRCGAEKSTGTVTVRDTLHIRELAGDTVLRWFEKIVWKEVEPETVFVYRDTIDPDTVWGHYPEAIIALDYSSGLLGKGNLTFTSLMPLSAQPDSGGLAVSREYFYKVADRFAIRAKGQGFYVKTNRFRPRLKVGIGSDFKVLGDTLSARVVPFAHASLVYRGLSLGPRIDTRGLHLSLQYEWRF